MSRTTVALLLLGKFSTVSISFVRSNEAMEMRLRLLVNAFVMDAGSQVRLRLGVTHPWA